MTRFKTLALATAGLALAVTAASAEDYPSKTIEVVTHAGAGGGTDVNSRMMMLRARRELGTDMVVVNKRGGPSGALAMQYFQTRPADGYTIMTWTNGHALTMALGKSDLKLEDMRPIARGTNDPQVLMVSCKASPYKNSDEFMAGAKTTKLKYGTTNIGGLDHITAYIFAKRAGGPQPDIVPFKGGGELATQLVAGSIDVGVLNLSEAAAQIEAGDICPMVVLDEARMAPIPDVKTAKEMGVDVVFATVRRLRHPCRRPGRPGQDAGREAAEGDEPQHLSGLSAILRPGEDVRARRGGLGQADEAATDRPRPGGQGNGSGEIDARTAGLTHAGRK